MVASRHDLRLRTITRVPCGHWFGAGSLNAGAGSLAAGAGCCARLYVVRSAPGLRRRDGFCRDGALHQSLGVDPVITPAYHRVRQAHIPGKGRDTIIRCRPVRSARELNEYTRASRPR
jgi:hypothetical protein